MRAAYSDVGKSRIWVDYVFITGMDNRNWIRSGGCYSNAAVSRIVHVYETRRGIVDGHGTVARIYSNKSPAVINDVDCTRPGFGSSNRRPVIFNINGSRPRFSCGNMTAVIF